MWVGMHRRKHRNISSRVHMSHGVEGTWHGGVKNIVDNMVKFGVSALPPPLFFNPNVAACFQLFEFNMDKNQ